MKTRNRKDLILKKMPFFIFSPTPGTGLAFFSSPSQPGLLSGPTVPPLPSHFPVHGLLCSSPFGGPLHAFPFFLPPAPTHCSCACCIATRLASSCPTCPRCPQVAFPSPQHHGLLGFHRTSAPSPSLRCWPRTSAATGQPTVSCT